MYGRITLSAKKVVLKDSEKHEYTPTQVTFLTLGEEIYGAIFLK